MKQLSELSNDEFLDELSKFINELKRLQISGTEAELKEAISSCIDFIEGFCGHLNPVTIEESTKLGDLE